LPFEHVPPQQSESNTQDWPSNAHPHVLSTHRSEQQSLSYVHALPSSVHVCGAAQVPESVSQLPRQQSESVEQLAPCTAHPHSELTHWSEQQSLAWLQKKPSSVQAGAPPSSPPPCCEPQTPPLHRSAPQQSRSLTQRLPSSAHAGAHVPAEQ
jgi:hypothetical protein